MVIDGIAPAIHFSAYNDDIIALERAVKERVFYVKDSNGNFTSPPKPVNLEFFSGRLSDFTKRLRNHLPSTVPISRQNFVDTYSGRKRVVYQNALESLNVIPFRPKDAHIKTFLKFEKTNFTSKIPVPRVISPRDTRYNIEVGRYVRPIEERIFKSIGRVMGRDTVMKGMNASQVACAMRRKWDRFVSPVAVGMDASRFDQHVSREALQWEHSVYLSCFWQKKHKERLAKLLHYQLNNRCFGRVGNGSVQFTTDGVRASGDMNTSLGACLIMCAMVSSFASFLGLDIELVNNGDDCVVMMEARSYQQFAARAPRWFLEMGFTMVIEPPVYTFERISFCQAQPVWVGPGAFDYHMVRDPRISICKDSVCLHPFKLVSEFAPWVRAVGTGGMALAGSIPVWQSFYHMYQRSTASRKQRDYRDVWGWGVRKMMQGCARKYGPISEQTRASFYWAFDVSPEEQLCIERTYNGMGLSMTNDRNTAPYLLLPL